MLSSTELKWLSYAVDECELASHSQWRVGAVIVKSGRVLSTGVNRYRNSPDQVDLAGVSYHAEEVAIRKAGDVRGATIYVGRITRSGRIGSAKPCARCQELLLENGLSTAIWTEPHGWGKSRVIRLEEYVGISRHATEKHPLISR